MASFSLLYNIALQKLQDLVLYQRLKRTCVDDSASLFKGEKRVIVVTDKLEKSTQFLNNIDTLTKQFGKDNIRCVTLEGALPQSKYPKGMHPISLSGADCSDLSPKHISLMANLKEFKPDMVVSSTTSSHKVLRRILIRTQPKVRISIGTKLPLPLSSIHLTDSDALLQDYFN